MLQMPYLGPDTRASAAHTEEEETPLLTKPAEELSHLWKSRGGIWHSWEQWHSSVNKSLTAHWGVVWTLLSALPVLIPVATYDIPTCQMPLTVQASSSLAEEPADYLTEK